MSKKISISFKNNTIENELFNYFNNLEDKGTEIKLILKEWYKSNHRKN